MTAANGQYHPGIAELRLSEGVAINLLERDGNMTTSRIRLLLDENRAVTDAKVQLTTANSITTGTGLDIDLTSSEATLLKEVETRYAH